MLEDTGFSTFLVVILAIFLGWLDQRRLKRKNSAAVTAERNKNITYCKYNIGWRQLEEERQSEHRSKLLHKEAVTHDQGF